MKRLRVSRFAVATLLAWAGAGAMVLLASHPATPTVPAGGTLNSGTTESIPFEAPLRAGAATGPGDCVLGANCSDFDLVVANPGGKTKRRILRQHTETLSFMRAQLLQARSLETGLAEAFRPLFGNLSLPQDEFRRRLDRLHEVHKDVTIHVAEGTRTIRTERGTPQIRVTVERPYVDLDRMAIVDNTRFILVEVTDR